MGMLMLIYWPTLYRQCFKSNVEIIHLIRKITATNIQPFPNAYQVKSKFEVSLLNNNLTNILSPIQIWIADGVRPILCAMEEHLEQIAPLTCKRRGVRVFAQLYMIVMRV